MNRIRPFEISEFLDNDEVVAEYLAASLRSSDPEACFRAVKDAIRALGTRRAASGTPDAIRAWISRGKVRVEFRDGREAALPLAALPRLREASAADVRGVEIWGGGQVLYWPSLSEVLPVHALLSGRIPKAPRSTHEKHPSRPKPKR